MAVDFTGLDGAHPCKGCRQCLTTDDLCSQCKALADCRSGSVQMAKWLEDNRLEINTLRVRLAAEVEKTKAGMCSWKIAEERAHAHECELINRAEKAEAENAALKAHVERMRVALEEIRDLLTVSGETIWISDDEWRVNNGYPDDDDTLFQPAKLHAALPPRPRSR